MTLQRRHGGDAFPIIFEQSLLGGSDDEIEGVAAIDSILWGLRPAVTHVDLVPTDCDRVLRVAVSIRIVPAAVGTFAAGFADGALGDVVAAYLFQRRAADGAEIVAEPQRSGQAIREPETNWP